MRPHLPLHSSDASYAIVLLPSGHRLTHIGYDRVRVTAPPRAMSCEPCHRGDRCSVLTTNGATENHHSARREDLGSVLVIALCHYPTPFRVISDSPFEGDWKAAALCSVILSVEFGVLLWRSRRRQYPFGWGIIAPVAATAIGAAGLALFAGWHATQGLPCFGAPVIQPTVAEVQQASAAYQTLVIVDALAILACVATGIFVVAGAIRLLRARR